MSVKLQFNSPAGGTVQRSYSFTGVNTLTGRHRLFSARTSLRAKGLTAKPTRILSSAQVAGSNWEQQPEQVEKVFQALQKGLKEYLQHHKAELVSLLSQQSKTLRNSRLAFFYDLEKEIRTLERYIRRLEFQISKVEGLHETYCIQFRLCQGAVNMKRAFSLSPSSRASQESLLELNRNQRHSLEDMRAMEGELEILLGELQIKMKGLVGFARLCPGDQYEVLIRLGRQRWRIRGCIQTDDKQLWNEEEIIFLPHIHECFEIKVSELKGLGSILVGTVICKCTDFYTAHPQTMAIDITELGTIKLQLEVVWSPFESAIVKNLMSPAGQAYTHSRKRMSVMHQFQDASGPFSIDSKEMSLCSCQAGSPQKPFPLVNEKASRPSIFHDSHSVRDDILQTPFRERNENVNSPSEPETPREGNSRRDTKLLFQYYSNPDILQQNEVVVTSQKAEPVKLKVARDDLVVEEVSVEEAVKEKPEVQLMGVYNAQRSAVAMKIGLIQREVTTILKEMGTAKATLKQLHRQTQQLNQTLKTYCSEALDVEEEEVLGSFDFLSVDFNIEDNSYMTNCRVMDTGLRWNTVTGQEGMSEGILLSSEQQYTGTSAKRKYSEERGLLSTEDDTLDQALEIHLNICIALLKALRMSNVEYMQKFILEELSRQNEVLEKIITLTERKTHDISATELWSGEPKLRNVMMLWDECCGSASVFCCSAESFLRILRRGFIHKVNAKLPGQTDRVFAQLLHQVQSSSMMIPLAACATDRVSLFQLHVYLCYWKVTNLGEHISQISREVYLVSCLETPKRRRVLKKIKGRRISELLPMGQTLELLARLLTDANHKITASATTCLCRASGYKSFREKALLYYTWLLRDTDVQVQLQACSALKCLKAFESAEQVAELWHSTDEELRKTARETILSFGKKVKMPSREWTRSALKYKKKLIRT